MYTMICVRPAKAKTDPSTPGSGATHASPSDVDDLKGPAKIPDGEPGTSCRLNLLNVPQGKSRGGSGSGWMGRGVRQTGYDEARADQHKVAWMVHFHVV